MIIKSIEIHLEDIFCTVSVYSLLDLDKNIGKKITYRISSSTNPRKACSSKHVISLLSICKLRSEVAPLKVLRLIIDNELCDRSLIELKNETL